MSKLLVTVKCKTVCVLISSRYEETWDCGTMALDIINLGNDW